MPILPKNAFTIIELLVVIALIIILAGLILSTVGYVQNKAARSRAETEIAAISAALENYKADNGIYPRDNPGNKYTDVLDARAGPTPAPPPSSYTNASFYLFQQLSGLDQNQQRLSNMTNYFTFKPQMLGGTRDSSGNITLVTFIRDPFGNSYGYSTAYQADQTKGYNPTFDLWSTANSSSQTQWIKNW
jgi:general secretion pathway protein G